MREFEELKAKLSEDPQSFVAILGAGVSIPAGLPSWSGLRDILCDAIPDVIIDEDDAQRAVDTAKAATDLWHSFSRLRTSLGPFKYEKTIRGALDITEKDIPPLYKQLWKLNISGIIDFNLDKFAINAYSAVNKTAVDFASARSLISLLISPCHTRNLFFILMELFLIQHLGCLLQMSVGIHIQTKTLKKHYLHS